MKKLNIMHLTIFVLVICLSSNLPFQVLAKDEAGNTMDGMSLVRAIALHEDNSAEQLEELIAAIAQATAAMDEAREQLFVKNRTEKKDRVSVNTIIEQNSIIVKAKHKLNKLYEQLQKSDLDKSMQQGYLSTLAAKAQNVGAEVWGKINSLYAYSADEKEIAREIVNGLKEQKIEITLRVKGFTPEIRNQLKKRYTMVIGQLNAAVYQQQLITGDVMSFNKKVLWGTVGAAAATAVGLAIANKYTASAPEETQQSIKGKTTITEHPVSHSLEDYEALKQMGLAQVRSGSTVISSENVEHLRQMRLAQADEELKKVIEKERDDAQRAYHEDNSGKKEIYARKERIDAVEKALFESRASLDDLEYLRQIGSAEARVAKAKEEYAKTENWLSSWWSGGNKLEGPAAWAELKAAEIARDALWDPGFKNQKQGYEEAAKIAKKNAEIEAQRIAQENIKQQDEEAAKKKEEKAEFARKKTLLPIINEKKGNYGRAVWQEDLRRYQRKMLRK